MLWIAPSEKGSNNAALEKRLWDAAYQFRAKSGLNSQEYSAPVLGLIFLCLAALLIISPTRAADWPQLLGPTRDAVYAGPALAEQWPADGPRVV